MLNEYRNPNTGEKYSNNGDHVWIHHPLWVFIVFFLLLVYICLTLPDKKLTFLKFFCSLISVKSRACFIFWFYDTFDIFCYVNNRLVVFIFPLLVSLLAHQRCKLLNFGFLKVSWITNIPNKPPWMTVNIFTFFKNMF